MEKKILTLTQWKTIGSSLYGDKMGNWKFVCPQCNQVQTLKDFVENNIPEATDKFYFSCIGRWVKDRGCNWTLGGLLQVHKTEVTSDEGKNIPVFEFADTL